ncbi:MAG TPA: peroxiredoxin [Beijerinckiaceae bacterium]|nr:peroxiredoxin [Beijerinckiaceae bacterium]HVB90104.1 peroxiredoxin [Beijerinckiaceae bacterium]
MPAKLVVGEKPPAFELPRAGGGPLSLSSLAGRKVVLYFYPKDDTSGCTREALDFSALASQFAEQGAQVIGVSPDSCASHDKFKSKHRLDLILLSDEAKNMLLAYGVWTEKSMYGRKYMGVERTTVLIGADGKVAKVWNKVKPAGHAQEVLDCVRAL